MLKLTRRMLIKQASIGAGVVGMLTATFATKRQFGSASINSAKAAEQSRLAAGEALVVCITNPTSGTLTVLRGERETTINNAALVQQLLSL